MSEQLIKASKEGNLKEVQEILSKGADINYKNVVGMTALLWAAYNGHLHVVKYLLTEAKPKASLTEKNNEGNTALLLAACNGRIETLKYLLTEASPKANLNDRNKFGDSVLSLSAWKGHVESVSYLLSQGAYIDLLFDNGNTPKQECEKLKTLKATPLLKAAEELIKAVTEKETKENIDALLTTLGMGVNARSVKQKGNTALHLAILNENFKIIISLLESGASLEITNDDKLTPYDLTTMSKIPFINMLGYLYKAKQLVKEITLQIQDGKNLVKKLENAEKLKSELEATLSKAIERFETLEDIDKQKIGFQLGCFLAHPENAPLNAIKAYEVLIHVNKSNPEFAKAHALMYRMLLGKHLLLAKSIKPNELGLAPKQEEILLDPKDERSLKLKSDSQELTLGAMIKHLLYSGLKDEPLKNYIAAYTLGNDNGIAAHDLNDFQYFQEPESCLAFIDAMRNEELALTRNSIEKEKEIEAQRVKNDIKKKEIEALKHEKEALIAKLATLGAGSGSTTAVPILSQFQRGTDTNKDSALIASASIASGENVQINIGSSVSSKFQKT